MALQTSHSNESQSEGPPPRPHTVRRLEALCARHGALETALAEELKRPLPDPAAIALMKRRKLVLKDEIALLAGHRRSL
jgi:hypothetical protein